MAMAHSEHAAASGGTIRIRSGDEVLAMGEQKVNLSEDTLAALEALQAEYPNESIDDLVESAIGWLLLVRQESKRPNTYIGILDWEGPGEQANIRRMIKPTLAEPGPEKTKTDAA